MRISYYSFGTPRASSTALLEFGEDLVQPADESCRVGRAGVCRFVAGIGQPVRPFDGPAQRRPMTIALQPDDPEPSPVARRVVVHAWVAHRLALADGNRMSGHQEG